MSGRFSTLLGVPVIVLAACVDTDSLARGESSGTSGGTSGSSGGTASDVEISPKALDLPETDCGVEAQKAFLILNRSKNALDYRVSSIDPAFVIASGALGTLAAGGAATIEVRATPNRAGSLETPLVVELNGVSQAYPVKLVGRGATFELSQTSIDFGDVRKENGGEAKLTVKNTGTKDLDTTLEPVGPAADFEIASPQIRAQSNGLTELTVRLKPGASSAAPLTQSFKPKAGGICGALPVLDVRGKRITTDVTVDVVDWGDILCKSNPADRDATIKNYGPSSLAYTSALTGTAFTITSNASANVAAGSEVNPAIQKIKLKANPGVVTGQKDETLTITYGAGQMSAGKVRAFVAGLVLAITPSSSGFVSNGTNEQRRTFNLSNSGKMGGYFSMNTTYRTTGAGFRVENGTSPFLAPPFGTGSVDVIFNATQPGTVNGSLIVDGAVCSQTDVVLTGSNP